MIRGWSWLAFVLTACAPDSYSAPLPVLGLSTNWHPVMSYLDSAVAGGAAPGAVLAVTHDGRRFVYGTGRLGTSEATRPGPSAIYDFASLTKVVGLTTALMMAVVDGKLDLDQPVQRYLPNFAGPEKEKVTVRLLLAHAGGLPAWRPFYREASSRDEVFTLAEVTPLEVPPASRAVYSDVGAILLTRILETLYQERIDSFLERRILRPLGMTTTRYLPPSPWIDRIAPTELDPWRGRMLKGEVHDENAAVMDGVSGHAGLFGSAEDLLTFAEWMLGQWTRADIRSDGPAETSDGLSITASVIREFTRRQEIVPGSSRALGWDTPSPGGSAGTRLSAASFGHTGFTGTSLWIDPRQKLAIILLSNRVHPTRENPRWLPVRSVIADLVMTTLSEDVR